MAGYIAEVYVRRFTFLLPPNPEHASEMEEEQGHIVGVLSSSQFITIAEAMMSSRGPHLSAVPFRGALLAISSDIIPIRSSPWSP